jgi:predicted RNase H-like HicB family nuclease
MVLILNGGPIPEGAKMEKSEAEMSRRFTLEYWLEGGCYVGRLREVPGVFSQGYTLEELKENIAATFSLLMEDEKVAFPEEAKSEVKRIEVEL